MSALVIAGPTATGKTNLAVEIALAFDAVVVSADAMQVYRFMDIGTGKATATERRGVVHHGVDRVDPDEAFDAADFVALADAVLSQHPRVVIAGGTSLYLQALVRGLVATPPVELTLRAEIEALADPYAELQRVDPELAQSLHPNDILRVVRGIEVFRQTGGKLSDLHAVHKTAPDRRQVEPIWLDREDLDERIDARVLDMIDRGYVAEVQALLDAGFGPGLKPMQSLGYRHLTEHLVNGLSHDEAVRRTQRDTRRFARKQRTWRNALGWEITPVGGALDAACRAAERAFESQLR